MHSIAIDIETVGPADWSEVDDSTREYLVERWVRNGKLGETGQAEPDACAAQCALEPGMARVVAVGVWSVEKERGVALVEGRDGDETTILREFWTKLPDRCRIVTFNGRTFDGPVLMIRCAQLGIRCPIDLVGYRYDISQRCDLLDVLTFMGASRATYSLDYWCRRFGIESPKDGVAGGDVAALHAGGEYDTIAEYVLGDVRATAELFRRLRPMLGVFKGGPKEAA